jgi:energy-coupling factor transporter ATP-binding protein EcfA2
MGDTVAFHGGVRRVAVTSDAALLLSQTASLGPSLALLRQPNWLAVGFGRFDDGGPAMRFAAGHADGAECRYAIVEALGDVLRNQVLGLELSEVAKGVPPWLKKVVEREVKTADVVGFIPRFNSQSARDNAMWMGRFLTSLARLEAPAGVVLLLRPFARDAEESSAVAGLRRYFENAVVKSGSTTKSKGDDDSESRSESWQVYGEERRRKAIDFLHECARSGAWWLSIRCFGISPSVARRVASLYWSCISTTAGGSSNSGEGGRNQTRYYEDEEPTHGNRRRIWSLDTMEGAAPRRLADHSGDVAEWTYSALAYHGLDPVLNSHPLPERVGQGTPSPARMKGFLDERIGRSLEHLREYSRDMVLPGRREMLVSGERLSSVLQLPVEPSPAMDVLRGFGYCYVSEDGKDTGEVRVGTHGAFPQPEPVAQGYDAALDVDSLAAHALVVGATGSGKTTTVVSLLGAVHRERPGIKFAILEGAKREYRHHRDALAIDGHYDLMGKVGYLELNVFEHPEHITPEAHISQIASLFEATLEMPVPLPALMREALGRAYAAYHAAPKGSPLRHQHPIRFWLMRAVLEVADECGYKGELASNIDAALRTRVRALSTGASGRVLRGRESWDEVARLLIGQNNLLELESIADRCSRSFVMSLFVLYFRYAIESARRDERSAGRATQGLRNLLVLEEAHRIIGKPANQDGGGAALEYFGNLLGEVRAYGCGVVISDQSPSRLIDDAMRNTNTKILMRLVSGEDVAAAVQGAGLPDGARGDIPQLQCGQAILIRPRRLPALVRIAPLDHGDQRPRAEHETDKVTVRELREELVNGELQARGLFSCLKLVVEWKPGAHRTLGAFWGALGPWLPTTVARRETFDEARGLAGCHCPTSRFDEPCSAHGKAILNGVCGLALRHDVAPAQEVEPFESLEAAKHADALAKAKAAIGR